MKVKIHLKSGKILTIDNIEESSFRKFANKVTSISGFVIFNDITILVSEIAYMEEVK